MSGTLDKLVRMANQIAAEFENQQPGNAAHATWDHIWHFWDPRMCTQIIDHLGQGGEGLSETGRQAIVLLRTGREAPSQTPATRFGVHEGGNTESDAG
jgi:formate dehydrogenase subunit delta